jgi:hypothetical protein
MQFQKGQSGNPAGRPRGSRNRTTILMQALLADRAEAIGRKVNSVSGGRRYGRHSPMHGSARASAKG